MSAVAEEERSTKIFCCASCGTAGVDDIELMDCTACYLVRYCSVKCQEDHRPDHEEECKQRAAELHDEILFKQPEGNYDGDCPICCLPLSFDTTRSTTILMSCCGKIICDGCHYTNRRLQPKCPFCRKDLPSTDEEWNERLLKRIEVNDPIALSQMGTERYDEEAYISAFGYWTRAAALGNVDAHYRLGSLYRDGEGVEKDEKRAVWHFEEAAIAGHPIARHNLGWLEVVNDRMDRAAKHWIIAAKLGFDVSLRNVKSAYKDGHVSKEDFAAALRGHHAAIVATKSPQRQEAEQN
jgi:hypothetical protein